MQQCQRLVALVADEQELFRAGLRTLLVSAQGFTDVVEVGTFAAVRHEIDARPDLALAILDLELAGMGGACGLEAVFMARPDLTVLVVGGAPCHAAPAGARTDRGCTFVPRNTSVAALARLLAELLRPRADVPVIAAGDGAEALRLTRRQEQVVRLIAQGRSNKEIARDLQLAEGTVKVHVNALYRSLSVRNRASAVAALARRGAARALHAMSAQFLLLCTGFPTLG